MKIALVYPSIFDSGFNKKGKSVLFSQIHEGLSILSAVCKKEGFTDINLIDLRALSGWDEFKTKIDDLRPDVAGITMMSPDYPYAVRCLDLIKESDPNIKTVVGGMHPTVMTGELAVNKKIDHIITGEGEIVFPELLRQLEKGEIPERVIKGKRPDVNELPFIDRELFDFLELPYDFFLPLPFATVLAGRGCNYSCRFCSPAGKLMHGPHIRRRGVDNVIEEIKHLNNTYGIKSIQFWDDCFTEDTEWVAEFCDKYRALSLKMPFVVQTRADIICNNPGMMRELKSAGLAMAAIGFESGNDRILKFMNKGATLRQNLEAARICKRLHIKIWAYNMLGLPMEKPEESMDTVRMIRKIKPYRSSVAFFSPHPGSSLYGYCKERGLSLIGAHDSFVKFPEIDTPKIKGIDYEYLKNLAKKSKRLSFWVRVRIRIERILVHKKNKKFRTKFRGELAQNFVMNKMAILRVARQKGTI